MNRKKTREEIIMDLYPDNGWILNNDGLMNIDNVEINESLVQEKLDEEPLRILRHQRNFIIAESDWMANSDVSMSDNWKKYRQELRDLPSTAKPKLDKYGLLTNVTWPTKPE
jgi:hypothetical protein